MYPLVVTTSDFGLRAFDYRGNNIGITLIIAKSLAHERDALQAMSRVGRWDEPCKRIVAGETEVVDIASAFAYSTRLNKYNNEKAANEKEKVIIAQKKLEEETAKAKEEKKKQINAK